MPESINTISAIQMRISADKMKAFVVLPRDPSIPITQKDLEGALIQAKVCYGVREELFQKICSQTRNDLPLLIAQGELPKRGEDGRIEFLINTEQSHRPQVDEHGRINWYETNLINNVNAGQVVARAIAPTAGTPGENVLGEPVPGLPGVPVSLPKGMNTRIEGKDLSSLVATVDGSAIFSHGRINVLTTYVVRGSVDFHTGNVTSAGSVKVFGDVKSGFEVKSGGDIEIHGVVEDGIVEAVGSIIVKGGFIGSGTGRIIAGRDVTLRYIENQHVEAERNVRIEKDAINASIECKGKLIIGHSIESCIIGGKVMGIEGVEVGSIGSENEVRTEVRAGATEAMVKQATELQKTLEDKESIMKQIKADIAKLAQKKYSVGLSEEEKEEFETLKIRRDALPAEIKTHREKLETLLNDIEDLEKAFVQVKGTVYPNVRVCIGRYIREFDHAREKVVVLIRDAAIGIEPLI